MVLGVMLGAFAQAAAGELTKLTYGQPSSVVDLGVGLWAWPIPCDADNDGDFDLIVSCPDKPSNGIWFFENVDGDTAGNKFPVFRPARRLSATVHYVLPSYVDGRLRVLSPGVEHPNFERIGLTDRQRIPAPGVIHHPTGHAKGVRNKIRHNQWRYADYDGDGAVDLIVGIEDWSHYGWDDAFDETGRWTNGPLHGFVYWLKNRGTSAEPIFDEPTLVMAGDGPVDTYGCPTPNFEDFDGDGDLDLLCGEFLDGFTYFVNEGTRQQPRYRQGQRLKLQDGSPLAMNVQMIVPIAFDWDRDGDIDLVVGDEDGRVALVENTGVASPGQPPTFLEPRYFQQTADELKCGALATPVGVDWDADGDIDLVSGNTSGVIEFFENISGPGVAMPHWKAPVPIESGGLRFRVMAGPNGGVQGPCEAKWGYTTLSVADWDLDGRNDIVFNSILGRVGWLRNIGTRSEPKFSEAMPIEVDWPGPAPKPRWTWRTPVGRELVTQWRTTPVVHDFNGDGLPDLAILDTEGYPSLFERQRVEGELRLRPPRRAFLDQTGSPLRWNDKEGGGSGRRKWCVTDWDGDGRFDILLNSTSADFWRQVGTSADGWLFKNEGPLSKQNVEGHDVSPTTVDFDGNGVPDFLGGAEDGRMYWLANPRTP
jgi:hypothetical protein